MRSTRLAAVVLATTALMACSSSTAPAPTLTGTWHVAVGTLSSGNVTPSSFNVTITQVSANSLTVSMPSLTWSNGNVVFDSAQEASNVSSGGSVLIFDEMRRSPQTACDVVAIYGNTNAARDTVISARFAFLDTATVGGQPFTCVPKDSATATVVKQ